MLQILISIELAISIMSIVSGIVLLITDIADGV